MWTKESVFLVSAKTYYPHTCLSYECVHVCVCVCVCMWLIKHLNDDSKVRANRSHATQSGDNKMTDTHSTIF